MKDSVVQVTVAGIIGAIIMDFIMYLLILMGVNTVAPWVVAADVFLTQETIYTVSGTILGLVGTVALSIAGAAVTLILLKFTGYDYAEFKGMVCINAFGFINIGLFMPLLKIAPQVQQQPLTNYLALIVLTIIGVVEAYILKKFSLSKVS